MPWIVIVFGAFVGPFGAISVMLTIFQPVLYDKLLHVVSGFRRRVAGDDRSRPRRSTRQPPASCVANIATANRCGASSGDSSRDRPSRRHRCRGLVDVRSSRTRLRRRGCEQRSHRRSARRSVRVRGDLGGACGPSDGPRCRSGSGSSRPRWYWATTTPVRSCRAWRCRVRDGGISPSSSADVDASFGGGWRSIAPSQWRRSAEMSPRR
jgi:hypothetical protein